MPQLTIFQILTFSSNKQKAIQEKIFHRFHTKSVDFNILIEDGGKNCSFVKTSKIHVSGTVYRRD